jgi:AcrR family transcriptional regulator
MRDIAREADVSMETVYATFGGKSQLLKAALDVAVVGDDEPSPLAERPLFLALTEGELAARASATGVLLATMHARTARLRRVLQHAAPGDPDLTALLDLSMSEERLSVQQGFNALARREPTKAELDVMFAVLSTDVYLLLVERSGWDSEMYRLWVADTVVRLFDL